MAKREGYEIMFRGFPEETIRFFLDIRFHNDVSFYKEHQEEYRQYVKEPFFSFIDALAPTVQAIAGDMEVRPGKCLARLRRDTRFTKDKSPFRDHLWLLFRRGGEPKETSVMYWFELGPEWVEWGLGFWGQNRPAMDVLRNGMERKPSQMLDALAEARLPDPELSITGEAYKRMKVPPEVPEALGLYYPLKSLYIKRSGLPLRSIYSPGLVEEVAADYCRIAPMYHLLRAAADEGMAKLDG